MENHRIPSIRFKGFSDAWEQCKFKDLAETKRGLTYKPIDVSTNGIRVLRSSNINEDYFEQKEDDVFVAQNAINIDYVKSKDILITSANGSSRLVGKHAIITNMADNTAVHGGFMLLARTAYPYFLNASMSSRWYEKFISLNVAGGNGAIGNLSKSNLDDYDILAPSDAEKLKIGELFKSIDSLITLHQRKCQVLINTKKALLEKMFPSEHEAMPKIRFKGFSDAWEQCELGNIGTTYTGLSGKNSNDFGHGEGKYVTYLNVFGNPISNSNMVERVEIDNSQNQVAYGDVFFTTSSETPEEVGMSSIWLNNDKNTYLNSFCFGFRPKIKVDPYYLAYMLRSPAFRSKIVILAQGISRYNISKSRAMELSIMLPSLQEQAKIGKTLEAISNLITLHQRKCEKLKNMKKSLLEKMFI